MEIILTDNETGETKKFSTVEECAAFLECNTAIIKYALIRECPYMGNRYTIHAKED